MSVTPVHPLPYSLRRLTASAALLAGLMLSPGIPLAQEGIEIPVPTVDESTNSAKVETAILAGGCFWGVQGVFQHVDGVTNAVSGYTGGSKLNPTYEEVSSGTTGHTEAVEVRYDPKRVSYESLLQVFWHNIAPLAKN